MLHQVVNVKGRCPFEDWINRFQIRFVSVIQVMFPEMLTCPGATRTPDSPEYWIYRTGYTPDVRVMMCHPSSCPIHNPRCLPSGFRHLFNHSEKGLMQLGEVGLFSRPVIHLGIDVDGVLAIPGRLDALVPHSL